MPQRSVFQDWVLERPFMMQSVLMTAVRGPDGVPKYSSVKFLVRYYRRSVLQIGLDGHGPVILNPAHQGGGSFTGPSLLPASNKLTEEDQTASSAPLQGSHIWGRMDAVVGYYLQELDGLPHHFALHFMHAAEIVGYYHPDNCVRDFWKRTYFRLCNDMHLQPEGQLELARRLSGCEQEWRQRSDPAVTA